MTRLKGGVEIDARDPDTIREQVEIGSTFHIDEAGRVWRAPHVYAPSVHVSDETGLEVDSPATGGWTMVAGHSNQYGYNGAHMSDAESFRGGMVRAALKVPGYYAIQAVTDLDDEDASEGWVLLHKEI